MNFLHNTSYDEAPPLNRNEIARYSGAKELTAEQNSILQECLDELLPLLSYKICWRYSNLHIDGNNIELEFMRITSSALARNLQNCNTAILFAATLGLAPDRLIAKYGKLSPVKALFCQAIGAERIESLCNMFCTEQAQQHGQLRPRFSPGYGDLPLSIQKNIFQVLDCPRQIGLTLTDSLLMSPTKSVTAITGF